MANDINRVIISGNLGADPEMRYLPSGDAVVDLRLASSRPFKRKDSDEWDEDTTWVNVTAFGSKAERVAEYASKGTPVIVEGRLRLETWEAKDGGGSRSRLSIVADKINPGARKFGESNGGGNGGGSSDRDGGFVDVDDIPF